MKGLIHALGDCSELQLKIMEQESDKKLVTFKDLGVCDQLVEACEELKWKTPTKIQVEAIPHALAGICFACMIAYFGTM